MRFWLSTAMLMAAGGFVAPAAAREAPPAQVLAISGCWRGEGAVMGKPVTIALSARGVAGGAMLLVEAQSQAKADAADAYAAHLLFGARAAKGGQPAMIVGFWSDSLGGDGAALGDGQARADGFDITYGYADAAFVNQWTLTGDRLVWTIDARAASGSQRRFADYALARTACEGGAARP